MQFQLNSYSKWQAALSPVLNLQSLFCSIFFPYSVTYVSNTGSAKGTGLNVSGLHGLMLIEVLDASLRKPMAVIKTDSEPPL